MWVALLTAFFLHLNSSLSHIFTWHLIQHFGYRLSNYFFKNVILRLPKAIGIDIRLQYANKASII